MNNNRQILEKFVNELYNEEIRETEYPAGKYAPTFDDSEIRTYNAEMESIFKKLDISYVMLYDPTNPTHKVYLTFKSFHKPIPDYWMKDFLRYYIDTWYRCPDDFNDFNEQIMKINCILREYSSRLRVVLYNIRDPITYDIATI